jgi:hypothetical protein
MAIFVSDFNSCSNLPPLRDHYVYLKLCTILKEVGKSEHRELTLVLRPNIKAGLGFVQDERAYSVESNLQGISSNCCGNRTNC